MGDSVRSIWSDLELPDLPPALALYKDNEALRNVYSSMALMVNEIWDRRALDLIVRDLSSHHKETNVYQGAGK